MSIVTLNSNSGDLISLQSDNPNKPNKFYIIDPAILNNPADLLGKGTTGHVYKVPCKVQSAEKLKEKAYAIKKFSGFQDKEVCKNEWNCNNELHSRLAQYSESLSQLGIKAGTGIENKPLFAFGLNGHSHFMVKRLYETNLNTAIQQGCFTNPKNLLQGARQLLEGLYSIMKIGALYFDIKPANILVKSTHQLNLAFTDFERIKFLFFDHRDDELIKNTFPRVPYLLAHEKELNELIEIRSKSKEEFLSRLYQLYSFLLGAAFFEMSTKMSLKKFLLVKYFTLCLTANNASETTINFLWEQALKIKDKKLHELSENLDPEYKTKFLLVIGHTLYPDIDILKLPGMQQALKDEMHKCQVPTPFIDVVGGLLECDRMKRLSIQEALKKVIDCY